MSSPLDTPRPLQWLLALALLHTSASHIVVTRLRAPAASYAPEETLADEYPRDFEAWCFVGRSLEGTVDLARRAGVTAPQIDRLRALARCNGDGCTVMPDAALTASLSRDARTALYRALSHHEVNRMQYFAARRPAALGPWSAMAGLSPSARALLDAGTWIDEAGRYAYSDLTWLCTSLRTDADRAAALAALRAR